jgi:hypothetical protein
VANVIIETFFEFFIGFCRGGEVKIESENQFGGVLGDEVEWSNGFRLERFNFRWGIRWGIQGRFMEDSRENPWKIWGRIHGRFGGESIAISL